MYRHIFKIGNARYTFNASALAVFLEEACRGERPEAEYGAEPRPSLDEFQELLGLYRAYRGSGAVDALLALKMRMEEVSVRCRSYVLAEEVLSINSCLPYECRLATAHGGSGSSASA